MRSRLRWKYAATLSRVFALEPARIRMTFNFPLDQDLECAFAVRQSDESEASFRVTTMDFGDHLVDYRCFTLYFTRLAQTRLFSGLGGADWSLLVLVWTRNRLSTTCSGDRIQGWRVNTTATVAIFFRLAFCPLVRRTERSWRRGLTMGIPLQSTAKTRIAAAGGGRVDGALGVEGVESLCSVLEDLFEAAHGDVEPAVAGIRSMDSRKGSWTAAKTKCFWSS